MLPKNEWWLVITNYNESIFPFQWIALVLLVALTLYMIYGDKTLANRITKLTLATMNLFIGIGFFIMSEGFPVQLRISQGVLFVLIGLLLLWDSFKNKFEFQFPEKGWQRAFFIIGMFVMMIYPFVGIFQGKDMNYCIVQGTLPCPTTSYTLILIITASKREGRLLYGLLLFWSIPFPPIVQIPMYGVYEDGIMFFIGLIGLGILINDILIKRRQKLSSKMLKDETRAVKPLIPLIVIGVLKGYMKGAILFMFSTLLTFPLFLRRCPRELPKDFLKTAGFMAHLYLRLQKRMPKEKAFVTAASYKETQQIIEENESSYCFRVTRCIFHEFFTTLGVAELTSVMCAVDNVVFNCYLPNELIFERKCGETIAEGSKFCSFRVKKEDAVV